MATIPGRAAALHRRFMDGVAALTEDAGRPSPTLDRPPRPVPVLPGAGVLGIVVSGLALGLAFTAVLIGRGWDPGAVAVGPWVTHPQIGTTAIDPYVQADLARSGAVPLSASEGLSFAAITDDTGYRLVATCSYRLSGDFPPARFWTLTATGPGGRAWDDVARRSVFTSTSVVRDADGRATIDLGPEARPGNWLALSGDGPITLTLRLYGTPLSGNTAELAGASLPSLSRQGCGGAER